MSCFWGVGGGWDASFFPILSCVDVSMAIGSYRDLSYNICIAREQTALVIKVDNSLNLVMKGKNND